MIHFTKKEFKSWLKAQPDDRLFYEQGASQSCPISLFAKDKDIGKSSAQGRILTLTGDSSRYREWVERIQDDCDAVYCDRATYRIFGTVIPLKDLRPIIEAAL